MKNDALMDNVKFNSFSKEMLTQQKEISILMINAFNRDYFTGNIRKVQLSYSNIT